MNRQQQRVQKQEFLRSQIPQDLYEDFGQFCVTFAGTIDIDGWTIQYIEELVQKFKQFNKKQQQQLQQGSMNQQSFHVYQTSEAKQIKNMMEKVKEEQRLNQKEENSRKAQEKEEKRKRKQEKEKKKLEKQSRKMQKQKTRTQQTAKLQSKIQKTEKLKIQSKIQQPKQQKKREKSAKKAQNRNKNAVDILQSAFKKKDQKMQKGKQEFKKADNSKQPHILNEQQFATLGSNAFQTGFQNSDFWGATKSVKNTEMSKKLQESFATNSHNFMAAICQQEAGGKKVEQAEQKILKDQGFSKINMSKVKNNTQEKENVKRQDTTFGKKKAPEQVQQATSYQSDSQSSSSSEDQGNIDNKQNSEDESSGIQTSETSISKYVPRDQSEVSRIHKGSSDSKQPHYKQNKLPYQGAIVIKQAFNDAVPCFKATIRQALAHPKFKVVINQHQIIHRNFFVPDYVMYTVRTLPNQIQVKRNYQDFIKLRKTLGEVYPGIQLPFLEKAGWLSQTHPETIKKQKISLQFFLNDIIYNNQLRNSRIIQDFLTIKQHKKIKRKFQEYDRLAKLSCIQQLCLLSGQVNVKLSEDQRIYEQKITQYIARMEEYFERHKKISQTLESQYESIMKTFKSLADLTLEIQMETCEFNKRVQCNEIRNLQKNYSLLNKVYKQSHQNMAFDLEVLNQKVMPFLRFEKQNIGTLREIIYTRNFFTKTFIKRAQQEKNSLTNQMQSYTSDKYKQYKSGICEESKNILVFKYQTGYMNNQVCEQSQRFFELLGNKINFRWSEIGKSYLLKLDQSKLFWNNVIKDRTSYISRNIEEIKIEQFKQK